MGLPFPQPGGELAVWSPINQTATPNSTFTFQILSPMKWPLWYGLGLLDLPLRTVERPEDSEAFFF